MQRLLEGPWALLGAARGVGSTEGLGYYGTHSDRSPIWQGRIFFKGL